ARVLALAGGKHEGDARGERARHAGEFLVDQVSYLVSAAAQVFAADGHAVTHQLLAAVHVEQLELDDVTAVLHLDVAHHHVIDAEHAPVLVLHVRGAHRLFQHVRDGKRLEAAAALEVGGHHRRHVHGGPALAFETERHDGDGLRVAQATGHLHRDFRRGDTGQAENCQKNQELENAHDQFSGLKTMLTYGSNS